MTKILWLTMLLCLATSAWADYQPKPNEVVSNTISVERVPWVIEIHQDSLLLTDSCDWLRKYLQPLAINDTVSQSIRTNEIAKINNTTADTLWIADQDGNKILLPPYKSVELTTDFCYRIGWLIDNRQQRSRWVLALPSK